MATVSVAILHANNYFRGLRRVTTDAETEVHAARNTTLCDLLDQSESGRINSSTAFGDEQAAL